MMSYPTRMFSAYWEENKRDEWLQELNGIILDTAIQDARGKDKQVPLEFDGVVGWGWKRV